MSLESVSARVREIESRIQALSPEPPMAPLPTPAPFRPPSLQQAESIRADGRSEPIVQSQPFNVTLAQRLGRARLQPTSPALPGHIEELARQYSALNGLDP